MSRFAFVIADLFGGGAQRSLLDVAAGLEEKGHDIVVYTLRDRVEVQIPPCLTVQNLNVINRLTKTISIRLVERWQASVIKKALDFFDPHVVLACACHRIVRHIDSHNIVMWVKIDLQANNEKPMKRVKLRERYRAIYAGHECVVPSQGVGESLVSEASVPEGKIKVIPNAFDEDRLLELSKEQQSDAIGTGPAEFFLTVGTLERRKRHDWLLRAYKMSGVDTPLVIAGKGTKADEDRLERQIEEAGLTGRVLMVGYLKNPYPLIRNAKALIMTSEREGLPRVLIESLMLKTPVVAFDCPSGPSEILCPALRDWLIPLGDVKGLANAITTLSDFPPEISPSVYDRFRYSNVISQFEQLAGA